MVARYAEHRCGDLALKYFILMRDEGNTPNLVTFTYILKACGTLGSVKIGEEIREEMKKRKAC